MADKAAARTISSGESTNENREKMRTKKLTFKDEQKRSEAILRERSIGKLG